MRPIDHLNACWQRTRQPTIRPPICESLNIREHKKEDETDAEWRSRCQTALHKSIEDVEPALQQTHDERDADIFLQVWCAAFGKGFMQAAHVDQFARNTSTGRGQCHPSSKATRTFARAAKQNKLVDVQQLWHVIRFIEVPNRKDHCYFNGGKFSAIKRLPVDHQGVDQEAANAISIVEKRYEAVRRKADTERMRAHTDKLNPRMRTSTPTRRSTDKSRRPLLLRTT